MTYGGRKVKIKRPRIIRSCDDDYEDDMIWLDRGDCYDLPSDPRPRPRSVSPQAHRAFETARFQRERRTIGFRLPV